jgi:hypothetical protein
VVTEGAARQRSESKAAGSARYARRSHSARDQVRLPVLDPDKQAVPAVAHNDNVLLVARMDDYLILDLVIDVRIRSAQFFAKAYRYFEMRGKISEYGRVLPPVEKR